MDRILKLVYPHTYQSYLDTRYFYNGLPIELITLLKQQAEIDNVGFNLSNEINNLTKKNQNNSWDFSCHSNFYSYALKYSNHTVTNGDDITNDGSIYLYPIEIKTVANQLITHHTIDINGNIVKYSFIDTIPLHILEHMRSGLVKIIVNIIHDPCVTFKAMSEFENYMGEYGVNGENIIFIWGNDYKKYQREMPSSKIKLTYGILPLQQQAHSTLNFPRLTSLGYVSDIVRETDLDNTIRNKRFLCFNRTMKPHRYMLAHLALKHNLLANSTFSFLNSNADVTHIDNQLTVFKQLNPDITLNAVKNIYDLIPYHIDTQDLERNQLGGFTTDNNKKELYLDSYIHLTSETLFEFGDGDNPFFSEKTFRPIQNLQPFIFVGEPFSLRLLHRLGFKTFSPFIDESYDVETDPAHRMRLIEKEIVKLNNMSIKELHDLYYSMTDILIYNQKHFVTFANTNPFDQVFNDINSFYS